MTREVLDTFRVIGSIQRRNGTRAACRYIISFTQSAQNVADVYELARLALALVISIVLCVLFCCFAGVFTAKLRIHPFISTLAHTCFVVGALYIFAGGRMMSAMGGKGFIAVLLLLLPNALLEAAAAAIVCAAVIASATVVAGKKSKLSQEDKN